jgi:hypothetical protein
MARPALHYNPPSIATKPLPRAGGDGDALWRGQPLMADDAWLSSLKGAPMKFRFSIRDLLWLTLVVALGFGWWADRRQLKELHRVEIQSLRAERYVAKKWQGRAEGLEQAIKAEGWQVRWPESSKFPVVWLTDRDGREKVHWYRPLEKE